MQRRYMLNEQRHMERLVGLHADGEELNAAYEKYWREQPKLKEREKQAKSALELLERGDDDALKELAAKHADAVAAGARDASQPKEQRVAGRRNCSRRCRRSSRPRQKSRRGP